MRILHMLILAIATCMSLGVAFAAPPNTGPDPARFALMASTDTIIQPAGPDAFLDNPQVAAVDMFLAPTKLLKADPDDAILGPGLVLAVDLFLDNPQVAAVDLFLAPTKLLKADPDDAILGPGLVLAELPRDIIIIHQMRDDIAPSMSKPIVAMTMDDPGGGTGTIKGDGGTILAAYPTGWAPKTVDVTTQASAEIPIIIEGNGGITICPLTGSGECLEGSGRV